MGIIGVLIGTACARVSAPIEGLRRRLGEDSAEAGEKKSDDEVKIVPLPKTTSKSSYCSKETLTGEAPEDVSPEEKMIYDQFEASGMPIDWDEYDTTGAFKGTKDTCARKCDCADIHETLYKEDPAALWWSVGSGAALGWFLSMNHIVSGREAFTFSLGAVDPALEGPMSQAACVIFTFFFVSILSCLCIFCYLR